MDKPEMLADEVTQVADEVTTTARALTDRFFQLAGHAAQQTQCVEQVMEMTGQVRLPDGETADFQELVAGLGQTLADFVGQVLTLSKHAVTMTRAIDSVLENLSRLSGHVDGIDRITAKTNLLSLNAHIEAERAGDAGRTFRVVAGEVRELSHGTAELAATIKQEIATVVTALRNGHETLAEVASMDMTGEIVTKERIDNTLAALVQRDRQLSTLAQASLESARGIESAVGGIVTGMQFEDRVHQRLIRVAENLRGGTPAAGAVGNAAEEDVTLF